MLDYPANQALHEENIMNAFVKFVIGLLTTPLLQGQKVGSGVLNTPAPLVVDSTSTAEGFVSHIAARRLDLTMALLQQDSAKIVESAVALKAALPILPVAVNTDVWEDWQNFEETLEMFLEDNARPNQALVECMNAIAYYRRNALA